VDVHGVLVEGRPDLDEFRAAFARPKSDPRRTLADAVVDADVLIGLSAGGLVTREMLRAMAKKPIIFALANPDPEISYDEAIDARPDAIVATGRSDFPNQVNNVLGFPFVFRGALDVHARRVSEEMKVAAAEALAELAREDVPDEVLRAYGRHRMRFGRDYIIPKPFDNRVLYWVAPAVAGAAMASGVARHSLDVDEYKARLYHTISPTRRVLWNITEAAKAQPKRIVMPEGDSDSILRAARAVVEANIAQPVLLGSADRLNEHAKRLGFDLDGITIVDPRESDRLDAYIDAYWQKRQRRGVTRLAALKELAAPARRSA
jgi:malate dehydrogenase (oxaloacetate-decarboxylating)(NADP+)